MKNKKQNIPVQLSPEIIREIAQEIDTGMTCYYHLPTGELFSVPDEDLFSGFEDEDELWKEALEKAKRIAGESIVFTDMKTGESFQLMKDFIKDEVADPRVKDALRDSLDRPKPFRRFQDRL